MLLNELQNMVKDNPWDNYEVVLSVDECSNEVLSFLYKYNILTYIKYESNVDWTKFRFFPRKKLKILFSLNRYDLDCIENKSLDISNVLGRNICCLPEVENWNSLDVDLLKMQLKRKINLFFTYVVGLNNNELNRNFFLIELFYGLLVHNGFLNNNVFKDIISYFDKLYKRMVFAVESLIDLKDYYTVLRQKECIKTNSEILYLNNLFRYKKNKGKYVHFQNLVCDRFGFWNKPQFSPLPKYCGLSIHKEASRRAKEIGYGNILWSGGIDSTYIACQFIKNKLPFRIFCDYRSLECGRPIYNWFKNHNIEVVYFDDIRSCYKNERMIHGFLADNLFAPFNSKRFWLNGTLDEVYSKTLNPDYYRSKVDAYGKYLNKPTDTAHHVLRLMQFGGYYIHAALEFNYLIVPNKPLIPFFATDNFSNISYTQYWDKLESDGKIDLINFINETMEDDIIAKSIHRTSTNFSSRIGTQYQNEDLYHNVLKKHIYDTLFHSNDILEYEKDWSLKEGKWKILSKKLD